MSDFFKSVFCCGTGNEVLEFEEHEKQEEQEEIQLIYSSLYSSQNNDNKQIKTPILSEKYYLTLENEQLAPLTKEKIINFTQQLEEMPKGFKMLETANIKLFVSKDGSFLSRDTYLGSALFSISKTELYKDKSPHYTLDELNDFVYIS